MNIYIFNAALFCEECGTEARQGLTEDSCPGNGSPIDKQDSSQWPQGPVGDGGGEADSPQHCDSCELFLENPLTEDGQDYVRQLYAEARDKVREDRSLGHPRTGGYKHACCQLGMTQEWANYYDYLGLPGEGNCCICTEEIRPHPGSIWKGGHNAEPVAPGRCCEACNGSVVLPERILRTFGNSRPVWTMSWVWPMLGAEE